MPRTPHSEQHFASNSVPERMELVPQARPKAAAFVAEEGGSRVYTRDELDLMRLGKKQVLKRNFGFMQILGFSCTVLVTWEGILQ